MNAILALILLALAFFGPQDPGRPDGRDLKPFEAHLKWPVFVVADHWLTIRSGVRHGRTCTKYFGRTYGRACGPNEGRECRCKDQDDEPAK